MSIAHLPQRCYKILRNATLFVIGAGIIVFTIVIPRLFGYKSEAHSLLISDGGVAHADAPSCATGCAYGCSAGDAGGSDCCDGCGDTY